MKINIVLGLANISDADICLSTDNYTASITIATNLNFVAPAVTAATAAMIAAHIVIVKTSVTALRTALAAPNSDTKKDNVRIARVVLDSNLVILANLVENVANAPTVLDMNREAIVHSAGMEVKSPASKSKREFKAVNNNIKGSIYVTAVSSARAHQWEYTTDLVNYTNRVAAESTTTASTNINGLVPGSSYAVFHKAINPGGKNQWEGPVFITVT